MMSTQHIIKLFFFLVFFSLYGCSPVEYQKTFPKEETLESNKVDRLSNNIHWHFFHKNKAYRFRLKNFKKDIKWRNKMFKNLQLSGFKGSRPTQYSDPVGLFNLFKNKTNLKEVELVKKTSLSIEKGKYIIPVTYFEIKSRSLFSTTSSYTWASIISNKELRKIQPCMNISDLFKEGWLTNFDCLSVFKP